MKIVDFTIQWGEGGCNVCVCAIESRKKARKEHIAITRDLISRRENKRLHEGQFFITLGFSARAFSIFPTHYWPGEDVVKIVHFLCKSEKLKRIYLVHVHWILIESQSTHKLSEFANVLNLSSVASCH